MSVQKQNSNKMSTHEHNTLAVLLSHLLVLNGPSEEVTTLRAEVTTLRIPRLGIGLIERYLTDFLGIQKLKFLLDRIQERRREWDDYKLTDECRDFIENTCRDSVDHMHAFGRLDTSPAIEIASLLNIYRIKAGVSLLPVEGAKIMTSVATAGSWQEGEWSSLAKALGLSYKFHVFKTVVITTTGVETGRSHRPVAADDICIKYDQNTAKEQWSGLSENLYTQLMQQSIGCDKQDFICHWGCISHNETRIPNHKGGFEAWAWHEHWNILYCIAMARHALEYLKTGGTFVLKVRIFEEAETLGLVSILSCVFEKVFIFPNAHQLCEFGMFVGVGFLGLEDDTVEKVKESLKNNTSYDLANIFSDALATHPKFKSTL